RKNWVITKDEEIAKITSYSHQYPKAKRYRITTNNKLEPCSSCALKDKLLAEEYCYFLLKDRANSLQEPDVKISILLPRPLSAFVNPPVEVWEALIKNNFKKRNLTIHLSTIKENHVIGSTTYPSYFAVAKSKQRKKYLAVPIGCGHQSYTHLYQ
ncbi:3475_t:CDS:2, partial [Gigaspora rosea]